MKIYNTLTRKKEELIPKNENEFNIYSCGPTVYDLFHIGNARPFIVFDTLRRYLLFKGAKVNFVQNFTDIDDKIINRANEENKEAIEISEKFICEYFKDAKALNILPATAHPKVTENIPEIIKMIQVLIKKNFAYESKGDVYYSARKFLEYGKLSKKNIDELEVGARVSVSEIKKDPLDFALWKKAKKGEPAWDSPWGKGRPGWHIECSALSKKYLGETIDIHGGGADLIFPHHENEIAQSEAANGKKFSKYFMHNGYININDQKMSKSLGNFKTVRDVLKKVDGNVLRFFILSVHYRSPVNFSEKILAGAEAGLKKINNFYIKLGEIKSEQKRNVEVTKIIEIRKKEFLESMEDDLNTAKAIGVIFLLVSDLGKYFFNKNASIEDAKEVIKLLDELLDILGISLPLKEKVEEIVIPEEVKVLANKRKEAREKKDFETSDNLRDEIAKLGFLISDSKGGQTVTKL